MRVRKLGVALLAATFAVLPRVAFGDAAPGAPVSGSVHENPLVPITLVFAGIDRGEFFMLVEPNDVWLPLSAFHDLPFQLPAATERRTIDAATYVSLRSLAPAVTFAYDPSKLLVRVDLTNAARVEHVQTIDLGKQRIATAPHADTSGYLNYSFTDTSGDGTQFDAFYEIGLSNDEGHFTASADEERSTFRRGLIAYSIDDQRDLRRETVGDEVASSGALGSSVVVGGVGYSRYFPLQPGFLRDASPVVSGTVLLPTQADVYVNGALYRTVTIEPGQFNLTELPVVPGANVTQVVLRDANGATTNLSSPYYAAESVLNKGLTDYDYHLGFVRRQPFGTDDRYGPFAGLGYYRVGLTSALTVGATFEKSSGQIDGGPTVDVRLPAGTLNLAASFSRASGSWASLAEPGESAGAQASSIPDGSVSGRAESIAYTYTSHRLSLQAFDIERSPHYSTLTLAPQGQRATSSVGESVAVMLTRKLNLELAHVDTQYNGGTSPSDVTTLTLNDDPTPRATVQLTLQRGTASPLDPLTGRGGGAIWTIGTSVILQIGPSAQMSVASSNAGGAQTSTAEYQKIAPPGLGLGYDVRVGSDTMLGSATYHSQYFDADTFLQAGGGGNAVVSATLAGSIDVFRQGVFFAEPVQSAYGLVRVDGLANAPVYFNGVLMGTTGKRGEAVIPNLGPYVDNEVSLGGLESLTNAVADAPEKPLNPRFASGTSTTFSVRRVQIFIGTLAIVQGGKSIVPAYGSLTVDSPSGQLRSDLGSNGEFYFENLPPGTYRATALYSGGGTCTFDLSFPKSSELQTDVGNVTCTEQ